MYVVSSHGELWISPNFPPYVHTAQFMCLWKLQLCSYCVAGAAYTLNATVSKLLKAISHLIPTCTVCCVKCINMYYNISIYEYIIT